MGPIKVDTAAGTQRRSSDLLLGLIAGLAIGVSVTNLVIGQRALNLQPQHHPDEPVERQTQAAAPPTINVDDQPLYGGDDITKMLKGEIPFPQNHASLRYQPGALRISSAEALKHCFINVTHYQGHIFLDRKQSLVSMSGHHKLIYRNNPKSSSSSARHAMQDFLEGEDSRLKHDEMDFLVHEQDYTMISFIREPLNRFYSSYDEAFFR